MDLVLNIADYYFFTPYIYPATWPEDDIFRQTISLLIITNLGAYNLYFFFATLSYYFVYDHSLMKHPQFLKNQVYREIMHSVKSMPWISLPTVSLFLLEVRGYSRLYDGVGEFPFGNLSEQQDCLPEVCFLGHSGAKSCHIVSCCTSHPEASSVSRECKAFQKLSEIQPRNPFPPFEKRRKGGSQLTRKEGSWQEA